MTRDVRVSARGQGTATAAGTKLWSRDFVLIIAINLLVFVNHIMCLSTFPFYVESLGGTEALAGLAAAAFSLVAVVLRPVVGWALDGGARRPLLVVGLCGMALAPMGYLVAPALSVALAFRMAHGASLACSNTTTSTIATDVVPRGRFAEGMGMFGMATALATAIAPALGLWVMGSYGFGALFASAAAVALLALVLFRFVGSSGPRPERRPLDLGSLVNRDAAPASAVMLVFMLTFGALENFLAIFASDEGLPSGGVFFAVMAAMLLVVRLFLGRLADERGEGVFVYTCNAAMMAALLLLAFAPNPTTFVLAAALAGYGFGGLEPAMQAMAVHIVTPERRGSANSTFLCAYDVGIGLGGGLAGVLITAFGYAQMFAALSLACVASVALYLVWGRRHPSSLRNRG